MIRLIRLALPWLAPVLAAVVGPALAQEPASDALIAELMRKSGAAERAERLAREMREGLDRMGEKDVQALGITLADFRAAATAAIDFRKMSAGVTAQLKRDFNRGEVQRLLVWFGSPEGEKSTTLLFALSPGGDPQLKQMATQLVGDPKRLAAARRAVDAMAGGEVMVEAILGSQLMGATLAAALDPSAAPLLGALREGLELQRPQLRNAAEPTIVLALLYALRSLSDDQLERFAAIANSPAMRKYHRVLNNASLGTARDAVEMLGQALAARRAAAPAGEPVGVSVQRSGNFTNVTITSLVLGLQNQLFGSIRQLPPSEDEAVIAWAMRHQTHLTPVFLYELSRRLWARSPDEAFEWYALGSLRARYDAVRCTDKSAPQGILILPGAAQNVAEGIEKDRAVFGAAGLRALGRADVFSSGVSPWWICSHGMGAINAAINSRPVENWLMPEAGWEGVRAELRKDMTRYFEEQGKPQDDPIAMTKRSYPVSTLPAGSYDNKLVWLDRDRLALASSEKGADGKFIRTFRTWKRDGSLSDVATTAGVLAWCAGNGNLYRQIAIPQKQDDGRMKLSYVFGPPGREAESSLVAKGFFPHARQENDGSDNWSRHTNAWRQSPQDCRWVESERLSGADLVATWMPLLPRHGFLRFRETDKLPNDGRLQYLATETAEPVFLPMSAGEVAAGAIGYYPYKGAYFIAPLFRRKPPNEARGPSCVWWLTPVSGKTEEVCLPPDALADQPVTIAPSRAGILRNLRQRNTPHGPKPGGLYLTTADGRVEKIYEGITGGWAVSPDGCAVAVRDGAQSRVIELCR